MEIVKQNVLSVMDGAKTKAEELLQLPDLKKNFPGVGCAA
jgi:hypothetical protein